MESSDVPNAPFIIAVDGTGASGKGTLSKNLAEHYDFGYLDTGLLYRIAAYHVIQKGINSDEVPEILKVIKETDFSNSEGLELYTEEVGGMASKIGVNAEVREVMNDMQREFPEGKKGAVVDGRDISTVIFPNADLKFFITASLEIRAGRRHKQLQSKGKDIIYDDVLRDLRVRDERDSNREVAPLKAAPDAIHVDTTRLDADSVLELVIALTQKTIDEAAA